MAVRIPWDKYETAILIDACVKVENNIISKEIAVSEVSADLRKLAISRGYEIDDIFRNENGISMQMTIMSALLQNKPSGLHNASKLFYDIRDIYINDHNAYTQILAEAKAMINGSEDSKTLFKNYVQQKAGAKSDAIIFAVNRIEEFAIATKVLNSPIFNCLTAETISVLRKRVLNNKFFVVKNKKNMNHVQQAIILLDDFVTNNSTICSKEDVWTEKKNLDAASTNSEISEFTIDFNDILSLAFTKPYKFTYKEITTINISSWTDLYIKVMREFIDEFPSRLLPGTNFFSGERVDLGTSYHLNSMRAPKQMTDTLYLETNLSATDIVKKIKSVMDLCNVDCKNLTIYYVKKESATNMSSSPCAVATPKRHANTLEKDEFYTYLVEEAGVSESTGRSYASQINSCETYAAEHSIGTGRLYTADTKMEAYENATLLLSDNDFQTYSRISHNAPIAALRKYAQFLTVVKEGSDTQFNEKKQEIDDRVKTTLLIHYNYGINITSPIEILRFRNNYAVDHNAECAFSDEELLQKIKVSCMEFNGKYYLIQDNIIEQIKDVIHDAQSRNTLIVYYEEFYNGNEEWLYEANIMSSDMLRVIMMRIFSLYQKKTNFIILSNEKYTELNALKHELARIWGNNKLRSFSTLHQELPWIPLDKIKYALSCSEKYFWNSFETYANKDLFNITEIQLNELVDFISTSCDTNGSIQFNEMPLDEICSENFELSETALFDIIFSYISEDFSRNGKVITRKGVDVDVSTAITQYCRSRENCKMIELETVMKETSGEIRYPVIVEAANASMVRLDYDNFVADSKVAFDVIAIDSILDEIVLENGIGLKEITTFNAFPYCGYAWNLFLLESYCRRFSERYRYTCITPNSRNAGVIISKDNGLDYHNIMAKAIARATININETDVFDFLISSGFMIKRQYANIKDLLELSTAFRERR